ncbi:MAG: hypothetical protein HY210_09180 [Candidatus Omnitrophica bacterium]|nr:hypothetical protein [Candidatus Omnitrophota bacterium]
MLINATPRYGRQYNTLFRPLQKYINLIAGIGGMSKYTRMTEGFINWPIAYALFLIAMIIIGILTWTFLVNQINRRKIVKDRGYK